MSEPTDAQIEAFKQAWEQAHAEGDAGNRVRRGLRAASRAVPSDDYQAGRWCGECRHGVVENPPCCTATAEDAARVLGDVIQHLRRIWSPAVDYADEREVIDTAEVLLSQALPLLVPDPSAVSIEDAALRTVVAKAIFDRRDGDLDVTEWDDLNGDQREMWECFAEGAIEAIRAAGLLATARPDGAWKPTRWWRAVGPDGKVWAESSDENEIRNRARPDDRIERGWATVTPFEWREAER